MNNTFHKDQKIAVFVDVQNMYYSAKNLFQSKVDFGKVLESSIKQRKLIRAFAYVIKADVGLENEFFNALENLGFEVRVKELQVFLGGAKKGDWDVGLCMDVVRMIDKIDVLVLVSGDGDYYDLLEYAKSRGVRTEVISFGQTSSSKLTEFSDYFLDMSENPENFIIDLSRTKRNLKNIPNQVEKSVLVQKNFKKVSPITFEKESISSDLMSLNEKINIDFNSNKNLDLNLNNFNVSNDKNFIEDKKDTEKTLNLQTNSQISYKIDPQSIKKPNPKPSLSDNTQINPKSSLQTIQLKNSKLNPQPYLKPNQKIVNKSILQTKFQPDSKTSHWQTNKPNNLLNTQSNSLQTNKTNNLLNQQSNNLISEQSKIASQQAQDEIDSLIKSLQQN